MSVILITLLLYIPLTLCFAVLVADRRDRGYLFRGIMLAWITLAPLTILVDMWLPFAGGGDDQSYFYFANTAINSLGDVFDLTRFIGLMEQPGYPWLLSIINSFTGPNLLAYKLLNLCFLILLALTWYRIAVLTESREFGRVVLISILCLAPLWYYVFFLLKDLTITLLQSLFLLGLVQQWRRNALLPWLLIGAATLALLPFRSALVMQNMAVLIAALTIKLLGRERRGGRIVSLIFGGALTVGVLAVASSPAIMMDLGVYSEQRVLGSNEMVQTATTMAETSPMARVLFPLIYLFSETSGLNPASWKQFDSAWLRGVLAIPWIFLVVPFFVLGVLWMLKPPPASPRVNGFVARLRASRLMTTPWGALLFFVLSMMVISWGSGDTTRWRIADMPVMATIAMAGWVFAVRRSRKRILLLWVAGAGSLFMSYYLVKAL